MEQVHLEGVILDWAGTTIDFGSLAPVAVFVHVFAEAGIEVTDAEARAPMGMLKRDHIRAMLAMPRIAKLWREKHGQEPSEHDVESLHDLFEPLLVEKLPGYTKPLPGVVETVERLRERGLKIGTTTGYNDRMMEVVVRCAKDQGYSPDHWVTADAVGRKGRPYPYMIFRNMECLALMAPWRVVKVGDTLADIEEGACAGCWTVGVAVGSSLMGLTEAEYDALSADEKKGCIEEVTVRYLQAGADDVIPSFGDLPRLLDTLEGKLRGGKRPNSGRR